MFQDFEKESIKYIIEQLTLYKPANYISDFRNNYDFIMKKNESLDFVELFNCSYEETLEQNKIKDNQSKINKEKLGEAYMKLYMPIF